jgi:hypothetical protein
MSRKRADAIVTIAAASNATVYPFACCLDASAIHASMSGRASPRASAPRGGATALKLAMAAAEGEGKGEGGGEDTPPLLTLRGLTTGTPCIGKLSKGMGATRFANGEGEEEDAATPLL